MNSAAKIIVSVIISLMLFNTSLSAQGCSDAGFCTMGAMKPGQGYNKKINIKLRSIEVSYYRGKTTLTPIVYVANIDASFSITEKLGFQVKIPYQRVEGAFDNTSGLGDISLSITRNLKSTENYNINATIGGKIPSNDSNLKSSGNKSPLSEGLPLPMYYQTSLGSYDIVGGISMINSKWMFATGIQMALTSNNNSFLRPQWDEPVYPSHDYTWSYDKANKLKRGTDVMIRIERSFRFSNYSFNIGILPIYRITQDEREDPATSERIKIDDTTGLAFTVLGAATYHFNTISSISISGGKKLTDRKVNPDGLTRNNVAILAYSFKF
jgi:hypothetical protein